MKILYFITIFIVLLFIETNVAIGQGSTDGTIASLEKFKGILGNLDDSNPKSILIAKDNYINIFKNDRENAEKGFRILRQFYHDLLQNSNHLFYKNRNLHEALWKMGDLTGETRDNPIYKFDKITSTEAEKIRKTYEKEIKELRQYMKCGFEFTQSEGNWYLEENYGFFVKEILLHFDFELKDYIIFLSKENKQRIGDDASLFISWDELRKRIIRWEKFAKKHPTLKEVKSEVLPEIKRMLWWYLAGTDNTRIYDWGRNNLKVDLRKSYENFIKLNTDSVYHDAIKKVYEIYKRHNFEINDEVMAFIKNIDVLKR